MANAVAPATLCSICWEEVSDTCGRSIVRLQCSHLFHLDCIGSAFNVTGIMQCPNCREVENGVWRRFENNNEDMDEDSDEDEPIDGNWQDMMLQQSLGNNWCPGFQRAPEFPLLGHRDCPIFAADHHLYGPSRITQISTSQVLCRGHELVHPAVLNPMCGNFIGANHTMVPSATLRAPQCGADGLPNFESVGNRVIPQPGQVSIDFVQPARMRRSNGLQGWLPAEHAPPPMQQVVHYVPALNSTIQNNPQAAVHGDPFFNLSIQNNPAANLVHHHDGEVVEPFQFFLYNMGPFSGSS